METKKTPEKITKELTTINSSASLPKEKKKLRPYGLCKGEFEVPDDFNSPLPQEILASF
ncbi:MAG: hypothetical protein AAF512_19475 [Pseudomonadota bacterium]